MPDRVDPAGVPLKRVREMLALRAEETSLRQVAREVGMSPSGLQKLLDGSHPYSATSRKLSRWYVRESSRYGGELSAGSAAAALSVLLQDLAPSARDTGMRRLLDLLAELYPSPPEWLVELREERR